MSGDGELADLAGKPESLVQLLVLHCLLARALDSVGLQERDLGGVLNISETDMIAAFTTADVEAVVTWNPLVSTILEEPSAKKLFDSCDIAGKIINLMVVKTDTLAANPDFGKAMVGAWYEVMGLMAAGDAEVLTAMAEAAGTDLAGYKAPLETTEMFYDPADAVTFAKGAELLKTMVNLARFLFDKGILGEGAPSAEFVGVSQRDGSTTGHSANAKFRFDTTGMQMAADGAP